MSNFIDVSYEVGFLKEDVKKFSHSLRDFRNYIHPYQQMSIGFQPDEHTAKICFQVLKAALYQIIQKNISMDQLFTNRMGINVSNAEITIRNDAPAFLRNYLLVIMKQYGMGLKKLREIVCLATKEAPDPNNWGENDFMNSEIQSIIDNCSWYRVYDIIELFYQRLNFQQKDQFENEINNYFYEKGIGWKIKDGQIETRGDEILKQI